MGGAEHEQVGLEQDHRFPSGPWEGFFLQPQLPGRHWMRLGLGFREQTITGLGVDWIGLFVIRGRYELESGKCWWTKRYVGRHDVFYQGYNEGKGIWGTWEIGEQYRGGFHIWPVGTAGGEEKRAEEYLEEPAVADAALALAHC